MSELIVIISFFYLILIYNLYRKCKKFYESEHERSCGFRSEDNYESVGLPFIISLPESKLTCENVLQQISIYVK